MIELCNKFKISMFTHYEDKKYRNWGGLGSLKVISNIAIRAHMTSCSPTWSGYCTAADLARLDGFLRRCRRLGYCEQSQPSIAQLFSYIDDTFFSRVMSNSKHILLQFLHKRTTTYSLRSR